MERKNIPYYQVAREALIKWNGLTEEEANKIIEEQSFEEIESKVGAKNSMTNAIDELAKNLALNEGAKADLMRATFEPSDTNKIFPLIGGILKGYNTEVEKYDSARESKDGYIYRGGYDINDIVMNMLEAVHNGWIKDNTDIFFTKKKDREQQFQYLPLELIGWDEAKSDLLFIKSIVESMGEKIDEKALKDTYHENTMYYLDNLNFQYGHEYANFKDIGQKILDEGKDIFIKIEYPWTDREKAQAYQETECPWTEEIAQAFQDEKFVQDVIIPQVEEKGIGKDYELMNKMAKRLNLNNQENEVANEFNPIFFDVEWNEKYKGYDRVAEILFAGPENGKYDSEDLAKLSLEELEEFEAIKNESFSMLGRDLYPEEEELFDELDRIKLDKLREKRDKLQERANQLSEAENLVEQNENDGQNISE